MHRIPLFLTLTAFVIGCDRSRPTATEAPPDGPVVQDAAFWDKMADQYETNAHPFTMLYAKAMLSRLHVGPGVRFLDVATGTGAAALPAAETGAEVVAIDFSERMVQHVRDHKVPNIDARRMDGQALELPDASFDVAVSVFGVSHFPDWNKGLREMARVTKSGGTAAVVTWRDPEGTNIYDIIDKVARELFPDRINPPPAPAGMVALSDPERLSAAMVAAGFEKPTVETLKEKYRFRVEQLFLADHWSGRLDAAQQKAVIDEVRRRFGHDGDNLFVEPEALLAIAKRR